MQARIPWPLRRLRIIFSSSTTFHSLLPPSSCSLQSLVPVVSSSIEIPKDFLCTVGKTARSRCSVRLWFTPAPGDVKWEQQLPALEQNYTITPHNWALKFRINSSFVEQEHLSDREIWTDISDAWLPREEEAKSVPAHHCRKQDERGRGRKAAQVTAYFS